MTQAIREMDALKMAVKLSTAIAATSSVLGARLSLRASETRRGLSLAQKLIANWPKLTPKTLDIGVYIIYYIHR